MTAGRLTLEDFDVLPDPEPRVEAPDSAAHHAAEEAARLEGYDEGYRSGWDDATEAAAKARTAIEADVAQNLRDLGFSYLEAREQMLDSVVVLLRDVFETFFPATLARCTAEAIEETLRREAERATDAGVEIRACPEDAELIAELMPEDLAVRPTIRPEPSLARGQAHVRVGTEETRIDLAAALAALGSAGRALQDELKRSRTSA